VAEEHIAEKIARLEQENEVLKKENERLRRPFRGRSPKVIPKKPGAKQDSSMCAAVVDPCPIKSMKLWKHRCRPVVRDAQPGRVRDRFSVPNRDSGKSDRERWRWRRSSVYPRSAPNLLSAPAAALPGDDSGGEKRGSGIPAQRRNLGSMPIATGWKFINCHPAHLSRIRPSDCGDTRAEQGLLIDTSRTRKN
jgi:hypothetical protein